MTSSAGVGLLKTRSRVLPPRCVGGDGLRVRSKDDSSGCRHDDCNLSDGRLKSPSRRSGHPSTGKRRVDEFSWVIQVSVKAKKCREWWDAKPEMKSAFWTAD